MARCANCGREIPDEDKTRLCEDCKRVILPFIKFMEGSETPAVKRLLSNEQNLRSAGMTDSGMEYLYRICQLHDRKREAAEEARAGSSTAAAFGAASSSESTGKGREKSAGKDKAERITAQNLPGPQAAPAKPVSASVPARSDSETEPAYEEEMRPIGRALPAAKWIMILSGTAALIWFAAKIVTRSFVGESLTDSIDVGALAAALSSYAGAYTAGAARKAILRMEEKDGK